jgi:hypothetical protein
MSTTQQQPEPEYDQRRERPKPDFAALAQQFTQFTKEDLEIIWERNDEIQKVSDFRFFLLYCKQHQLNPVAGEVVGCMRYDSIKGKQVMTPIVKIGVLRRSRALECDGMDEAKFTYDGAALVSAAGSIYRKGSARPFSTTVYYKEYAPVNADGRIAQHWREKPHIMLGACLEAQLTRIAFFDLCGDFLTDEETQARDHEAATAEPEPQLKVGVKPAPEPTPEQPKTQDPEAPPPAPAPPQPAPPQPAPPQPAPPPDLKARSAAVRAKLGGDNPNSKGVINDFFRGCFATDSLPKKTELYAVPIQKLEEQTATPAGIDALLKDPRGCGARSMGHKANPMDEFGKKHGWTAGTMQLVAQIAKQRDMQPDDMLTWFDTLDLGVLLPADAEAFFQLAALARNAYVVLDVAKRDACSVASVVAQVKKAFDPGAEIDTTKLAAILEVMEKELAADAPY